MRGYVRMQNVLGQFYGCRTLQSISQPDDAECRRKIHVHAVQNCQLTGRQLHLDLINNGNTDRVAAGNDCSRSAQIVYFHGG